MNRRLPFKQAFRKALSREYSNDCIRSWIKAAELEYNQLMATSKFYESRILNFHLQRIILPGLAVYRSLNNLDIKMVDAYRLTEAGYQNALIPMYTYFKFWGRFPLYYRSLRRMTRSMVKKMFPAEGWQIEWLGADEKRVAFNMHSCFYFLVLRDYDAEALTPVFCKLDSFMYNEVSSHMRWGRTQTIATGGELCDFRFYHIGDNG